MSTAAVRSAELDLFFLPILSQWPTSGYMSMDRNSADPAARALKTKLLAERTSVEFLGFQRSQKPEVRVGEEKGE